jgi:hypothetical protein
MSEQRNSVIVGVDGGASTTTYGVAHVHNLEVLHVSEGAAVNRCVLYVLHRISQLQVHALHRGCAVMRSSST